VRKCPYCDFNSHEAKDGGAFPEQEYLDALRPIWKWRCR
jgi:oxygen-independent coproporphyrinogen-3 oxidase